MPELLRKPLTLFRTLYHAGNVVTCPVCNRSFRRFMRGGNDRRPNARCPFCDALERHRLFGLYLRRKTELLTGNNSLLHFAPERCFRHLFNYRTTGDYVTADLDAPLAEVHTDITSLVFPDNRFDAVICLHVLEHIGDDGAALAELFRVLKPGGIAHIMTPVDYGLEATIEGSPENTPEERQQRFGAPDHLRAYGRDFPQRLSTAGFQVKTVDLFSEVSPEEHIRHGLLPEEFIYRCARTA